MSRRGKRQFELYNDYDNDLIQQWLDDDDVISPPDFLNFPEEEDDVLDVEITIRPQRIGGDTVTEQTVEEELVTEDDDPVDISLFNHEQRDSAPSASSSSSAVDNGRVNSPLNIVQNGNPTSTSSQQVLCGKVETRTTPKRKKKNIKWYKGRTFLTTPFRREDPVDESSQSQHAMLESPLFYFQRYIPDNLIDQAVKYTNQYALGSGSTMKMTTPTEMRTFFALQLYMGVLKYPRIHMYWNSQLRLSVMAQTMSRTRFFQLRNHLHFAGNDMSPPPDQPDRLWKVRPLYNAIRERCLQLEVEDDLSIDEQMVPFTGQMDIKQYIKGKPHPWGIKIFVLCGKSGTAYDFIIYQGSNTEIDPGMKDEFGVGGAVVLALCKRLALKPHRLYFDNFFNSHKLLCHLKTMNIQAAGTVRTNRFGKPPLTPEKTFKKLVRGSAEEVVSKDGVILVKWLDNKSVHVASNFVGIGEKDIVKRWEKKSRSFLDIERPEIIGLYNKAMGGVDLLDQLISHYRTFIRSRKWTLRMISHGFDLAVVNAHLEYKKDCESLNIPAKKVMDLLQFRMTLADELVKFGEPVTKKRGRPSASSRGSDEGTPEEPPNKKYKKLKCAEIRPSNMVRFDQVGHFARFSNKEQAKVRCKFEGCVGKTDVYCVKCRVHLCQVRGRNYFYDFHHP